MFLENLKSLKTKFNLIFFCFFILIASSFIINLFFDKKIKNINAKQTKAREFSTTIDNLTTEIIKLSKKNYNLYVERDVKSVEIIDKIKNSSDVLLKTADQKKNDLSEMESNLTAFSAITGNATKLSMIFAESVTQMGITEKDGMQGKLRDAVHVLEAEFKSLNKDDLMVKLLMLRRHEKDFMLRGDEESITKHGKVIADLMPLLGVPQQKILQNYVTSFKDYVESYKKIFETFSKINENAKNFEIEEEKLSEMVKKQINILNKEYEINIRNSFILNISLFLFIISYSIFLLWKPVRGIINTMAKTAEGVGRIAAGEQNIIIPGAERADEIGLLVSSLDAIRAQSVRSLQIQTSLDFASIGLVLADTHGHLVHMNKAFASLFQDYAHILPRTNSFNPNDFFAKVFDQSVTLTDIHSYTLNTFSIAQEISWEVVINPVLNNHGKHLGYAIQVTDLTNSSARFEKEVSETITHALSGDLSRRLSTDREGFLGVLSQGMNRLLETVSGFFTDIEVFSKKVASGDLSARITKNYEGQYGALKDSMHEAFDQMRDTLSHIQNTAQIIHQESEKIAQSSDDLSMRTENQASSLEETAASMEEISSTVRHNADNAAQAQNIVSDNRNIAEKGSAVAQQAIESINKISNSSKQISEIINVIDEIAFQTNLLALNAAVESARAGEAGKGFAVVADEVRSLAQRSSEASKEIKALINNSMVQVKEGVELVNHTGSMLNEILASVHDVSRIVV